MKILVVIPSRGDRPEFLERAIASIGDVDYIVSTEGTQAEAMNAGAQQGSDYLAFLEDDDWWEPGRVDAALLALEQAHFCSSTQLEMNRDGIVRINDFPTPSGWFMKREVWQSVGPFNTAFRYHLDNEWLGRLTRTEFKRVHLVEASGPREISQTLPYRPFLHHIVKWGHSGLKRHGGMLPLVNRTVHAQSNMATLARDEKLAGISVRETKELIAKYGFMPV